MISGCFKRSDKPKTTFIERLAARLKKKGRSRVIHRDIFTQRGIDYNHANTVHVSTVSDGDSPTGVRNHYRQKYLERYYLFRSKWLAIYIHRFWASDEDPLHDHPWSNISWVRIGGYWENLPDGQRLWRSVGFKAFRTAPEFHRVELQPGTEGKVWTVFFRFRRRRQWGFWHQDGWKAAVPQSGADEIFN
jgi:hypothetical protein